MLSRRSLRPGMLISNQGHNQRIWYQTRKSSTNNFEHFASMYCNILLHNGHWCHLNETFFDDFNINRRSVKYVWRIWHNHNKTNQSATVKHIVSKRQEYWYGWFSVRVKWPWNIYLQKIVSTHDKVRTASLFLGMSCNCLMLFSFNYPWTSITIQIIFMLMIPIH